MKNQGGLDSDYFERKFKILARDCHNYRPSEMANELENLLDVACEQMFNEPRSGKFRTKQEPKNETD